MTPVINRPQQALEQQESAALQYALRRRALDWEQPGRRVLVIDGDQGCNATSAEGRMGFQRWLPEVSLDHVGLVPGIEMSRPAGSFKDWHQLLELRALAKTVIVLGPLLLAPSVAAYTPRLGQSPVLAVSKSAPMTITVSRSWSVPSTSCAAARGNHLEAKARNRRRSIDRRGEARNRSPKPGHIAGG